MQLIVISGRSGSGKSTALHQLEDEGYYAIDNLPASLLPALVAEAPSLSRRDSAGIAVCIDARNAAAELGNLEQILGSLPETVRLRVLYLDADENTLINRFSETRRRHPLSSDNRPLAEAIRLEQDILEPLAASATLTLDTSQMSIHELRDAIRQRLVGAVGELSMLIQSFGFKRGVPADADLVFDLRMLPNPHWSKELRLLTGRDIAVHEFLESHAMTHQLFDDISGFIDRWLPHYARSNRSYITIALGCTGGQHRSVYMAERLHSHCQSGTGPVHLRHRELR
ncbi:MAG: RNase adapter RapZ [Chromatocurvus sp.]